MYDKILDFVDAGGEKRNVEFKINYDWSNNKHRAKIAKCIMAMSNIKDGGYLIFGVDDKKNGRESIVGMERDLYEKLNYDDLIVNVNKYADPPLACDMHKFEEEGKCFVVIKIPEFKEIPIVCKKTGEAGLTEGAVFSRSRVKPESSLIRSQLEMRELIDIAIDKGVREFYTRVMKSGLKISGAEDIMDEFQEEVVKMDNEELIKSIKEKGYWKITIRPSNFVENKIETLADLKDLLYKNKLSLRGWDFPHFRDIRQGYGYVEASEDWGRFKEIFRFYQSGQFVYYKAMYEEWMEDSDKQRVNDGKGLEIISTIYLFTEIFEFAQRLTVDGTLGSEVVIEIEANGLEGRELFFYEKMRFLHNHYISKETRAKISINVNVQELLQNGGHLAISNAIDLFKRFGWEANGLKSSFKDEQQKLLYGRV